MKNLLFSIGIYLLSFNNLLAQQVQVTDTPPNWTAMMSNLNTTQITSGILYNKVIDFSKLKNLKIEKNFQDSS